MWNIRSVPVACALLLGAAARADGGDPAARALPAFRVTTSQEGLPQNSVMSLARDAAGRLWVATQDGAAVFNGQAWRIHNMPDRSRSNFLRRVTVGSDGTPWAARQDGGLARFRNGAWERVPEAGEGRFNDVLAVGSEVWAATPDAGLRHFDGARWHSVGAAEGLPSDRVLCLGRDAAGAVLAGTGAGLAVLRDGRWQRDEGLPAAAVGALGEGLVGTREGLFRWAGTGWTAVPLPPALREQRITAVARATARGGREVLWAGFDTAGLACLDRGEWRLYGPAQGLPSGSVWSLLPLEGADGTRTLLAGTDGGLATLEPGQWRTPPSTASASRPRRACPARCGWAPAARAWRNCGRTAAGASTARPRACPPGPCSPCWNGPRAARTRGCWRARRATGSGATTAAAGAPFRPRRGWARAPSACCGPTGTPPGGPGSGP
jgi:hypothetical protein